MFTGAFNRVYGSVQEKYRTDFRKKYPGAPEDVLKALQNPNWVGKVKEWSKDKKVLVEPDLYFLAEVLKWRERRDPDEAMRIREQYLVSGEVNAYEGTDWQ
jgi:hypothetical protein